jgi:hypothetical protein
MGLQIRRILIASEARRSESREGEEDGGGGEQGGREESGDAGAGEGEIIHIRVPRSFTPPHRVIFQGVNRFFGRDSVSAHQLSMPDLRRLFGQERDMYDRVRAFIGERFLKIQAGDTPVPVKQTGSGLVMHLAPLMDFAQGRRMEISQLRQVETHLMPLGGGGSIRATLDGLCFFRTPPHDCGYTLMFRDGSIEAFQADAISLSDGQRKLFAPHAFKTCWRGVQNYLRALTYVGASPQLALQLALFGISDTDFVTGGTWSPGAPPPPIAETLRPPESIIEDLGDDRAVLAAFREQLDFIWNGFGYDKCSFFDNDGAWNPPR